MENGGYLFAAYSVVWVAVFAYITLLIRRQKRLHRDIELLRQAREKQDK
ncbi:MAG: CcmD family protein [Chloroflexi bacterium]|nr:CcmD family protein [Chloroflexota bacterium]